LAIRIDLVSKVYAQDAAIKDENGWLAVSLNKPQLFRELVYYYDDSAAVKTVTSMLFHLNGNSFSTIREQLLQKYGAKAIHEDRKHGSPTLKWSDGKKTNFELSEVTLQIDPKY
jgi:hypothetical protein